MQYVRCDACGAKALFAASRCPKCTHAFFLRDHRGEMVPLAHCRKCETYYPRSAGGCKWCGTKTVPASISARTVAIGAVSAVALAALVYFQRFADRGREERAAADSAAPASQTRASASPPPVSIAVPDPAAADTMVVIDTVSQAIPPSVPAAAMPVTTAPAVATVPPPPGSQMPANVRWMRATALTYINVRSGADRKAPVVGVVTPSMKVELGARLHGWRQVRAPGIVGWADPRNFTTDSGLTSR